ncbi:MAG: SET domain-containing protein [Rhodospirillales bacterium]|nr:SET domain-containing protein [Alphaproteobacteria bacterium]MCB9977213.1 SET domain-containing protein [Rhodospirillales bacterium]
MLVIKGYTGPDSYGGTGLFAGEDIPKGALVWKYDPSFTRFLTVKQYFSFQPEELQHVQRYSYPIATLDESPPLIGLLLCADISRFFNHSDAPNIGRVDDHDGSSLNISLQSDYALRDIAYGEELTCDYMQWDPFNIIHSLGIVTGNSFLINNHSVEFRRRDSLMLTESS